MGMEKKEFFETEEGWVDPETGERKEGIALFIPKRETLKEDFMMIFLSEIGRLVELKADKALDGTDLAVAMALLANVGYENWVQIPKKDIAAKAKLAGPNLSRSIRKLRAVGFLLEEEGPLGQLRINPFSAWRGSIQNLKAARKEKLAKNGLRVIEGGRAAG